MNKEEKKIIEIYIGFNTNTEKIEYINSDFMDEDLNYKDPIGYTGQLMEMALEKWVRDNIGVHCPECSVELEEDWKFCPNCGWNDKS